MTAAQAVLFEPSGAEVGPLAMGHIARAQRALKAAEVADARGWPALASAYREQAADEFEEAECLAMLAEFERLGGVAS